MMRATVVGRYDGAMGAGHVGWEDNSLCTPVMSKSCHGARSRGSKHVGRHSRSG